MSWGIEKICFFLAVWIALPTTAAAVFLVLRDARRSWRERVPTALYKFALGCLCTLGLVLIALLRWSAERESLLGPHGAAVTDKMNAYVYVIGGLAFGAFGSFLFGIIIESFWPSPESERDLENVSSIEDAPSRRKAS